MAGLALPTTPILPLSISHQTAARRLVSDDHPSPVGTPPCADPPGLDPLVDDPVRHPELRGELPDQPFVRTESGWVARVHRPGGTKSLAGHHRAHHSLSHGLSPGG